MLKFNLQLFAEGEKEPTPEEIYQKELRNFLNKFEI